MREYFVLENIGQKTWYKTCDYILPEKISTKINGKKCVSIFYQPYKTKHDQVLSLGENTHTFCTTIIKAVQNA